jgi:hypothetical protein
VVENERTNFGKSQNTAATTTKTKICLSAVFLFFLLPDVCFLVYLQHRKSIISFCFNSLPLTAASGMQRYVKLSANPEKLNDRLNEINDPAVRSSLLNGGFHQIISRSYGATPWGARTDTWAYGQYWTTVLYSRVSEAPVNIKWSKGSSKYITSYHPFQLPRPHDNHSSKSISPILVTRLKAVEFSHRYFDSIIQAGRDNPNRYFECIDLDLSNRLYSSSLLFAYVSFQLHNA